jgi:hypothetical protein
MVHEYKYVKSIHVQLTAQIKTINVIEYNSNWKLNNNVFAYFIILLYCIHTGITSLSFTSVIF